MKSTISINNVSVTGRSIVIRNNKVIIDGVDVTPDAKQINIVVNGSVDELDVDYCEKLEISGDVGRAQCGSGDINCNNITGGAQTGSGDIDCGDITGNVQTGSGDVNANNISGSVKTGSGDIKYKKSS
jgi:hypothetical protein